MSGSHRQAILGFAGALVVVASLPWLAAVDSAVYDWLQYRRDCEFARLGSRSGLIAVGSLIAAGALLLRRRPPLRAFANGAVIAASGAAAVELLKILFERLRPNQLPAELVGNAFPSGHVSGTALVALVLWTIARSPIYVPAERLSVLVLASTAVLSQAASRLVFGAHWPTDVVGSLFLAIGWVGAGNALAAATLQRPWRWMVPSLLAAAAILVFPALRIHLPTPHEGGETVIDFNRPADRPTTRGDWRHGDREPAGSVAWLRAMQGAIVLPAPDDPPGAIGIGLRPTARGADRVPGCVIATFSLNDWTAPPVALLTGWREVRLRPPPSAWRNGGNQLGVALEVEPRTRAEPSDFGWLGLLGIRYGRPAAGRSHSERS